jgi:hypothetical protein
MARRISLDTDASGPEVELADAVGNTFRVPVEVIAQAGGPEILVLKVRTLTIRGPARIVATGARALAVAAAFDIVIEGRLDASASATAAGASIDGIVHRVIRADCASGGGGNSLRWQDGRAKAISAAKRSRLSNQSSLAVALAALSGSPQAVPPAVQSS